MSDVEWLNDDEQYAWRRLLTVHARLLNRLDADLQAGHELAIADYEVLVQLSEAPGRALRMAELAGRLLLSPSGMTRRVDSMVRQGLVARRAVPDDGRGLYAVLTDSGLARLQEAAPTHVAGVRNYLIGPLGPVGLARMSEGLAKVDEALVSALGARRQRAGRRSGVVGES